MTAGDSASPVVVVTGAAGTLGKAIAHELSGRSALLVLVDRDESGLEELTRALASAGGCVPLVADITRDDAAEEVSGAALAAFGRLDVLVNNAGTEGPIGPIEDVAIEAAVRTYQLKRLRPVTSEAGMSASPFVAGIPAARFADPSEVANLAAYLAFDAPTYLTGATLVIDGAMRA